MRKSTARFMLFCALTLGQLASLPESRAQNQGQQGAVPIGQLLDKVRSRFGINLLYEPRILNGKTSAYQVPSTQGTPESILREMLKPLGLKVAKIDDKNYAIVVESTEQPKTTNPSTVGTGPQQNPADTTKEKVIVAGTQGSEGRIIRGRVLNREDDKPLPSASVMVKGTRTGITSNENGEFELHIPSTARTLTVQYVGYTPADIAIGTATNYTVRIEPVAAQASNVVVMGIVQKNKEQFTGAAASFSGQELKTVNNFNIMQSLAALDPSFVITENNAAGANPNKMPDVEIRGNTSIDTRTVRDEFAANPNLPLFILDGFEVPMRTVVDLDVNRIESITLLKDAASTAIYGARSANGVVVVETKRPKQGKVELRYNGDFRLEMPDLTGYNMMNSFEKLEFEKLSGFYGNLTDQANNINGYLPSQFARDSLYYARIAQAQRGVNTYWLSEPVQNGFTQGHSISAQGGDNFFRYIIGGQYRNSNGVMKGSGRENWQGNVDLSYRNGRWNITNRLMINGYTADESPYGSFSAFVNPNPYFSKTNPDGSISKVLDSARSLGGAAEITYNPLYDASLNNINKTSNFGFQNNLQLVYSIAPGFELQGGAQVQKSATQNNTFLPPERSQFANSPQLEKGLHSHRTIDYFNYQVFGQANYGKLFGGKHQVNANLRGEFQESRNTDFTTTVTGFPPGSTGNPSFSFGYQPNSKPATSTTVFRRNNFLLGGSYTFNRRFVVDGSLRMDGSTVFGSNKKYSPFWSTGLGWNLHNEGFAKGSKWINVLRLKGNIGMTGNQSFGQILDVSVYNYLVDLNNFGQGVSLSTLGNPNLEWQKTMQTNLGLDFTLFKNKFSGYVNVFRKYTEPLIVMADLPASTGLSNYPLNVGHQDNRGVEANLRYSIIYKPRQRFIWSVSVNGIYQKAEYGGFNNSLAALNKQMQDNKSFQRFRDGYSPNDLWAVPSLGIDPATGREMFLKKDGQFTFDWDANDIVRVGNSRPLLQGTFGSNLSYKGFSFGFLASYKWKGDVFNNAMFNRVENISYNSLMFNQDKRALYDRWKKPGDITQFKAIGNTVSTPISSRFLQEESTVQFESVNASYDFVEQRWLKKAGMTNLRLTAYMNNVWRLSTVRRERGIDYPFSRQVAFSISTTF